MFFFFQAEDGIRDLTVTGVQTCALPISLKSVAVENVIAAADDRLPVGERRPGEVDARRYVVLVGGKDRSEEHTSELQSQSNLVCRLLLEKKNTLRRGLAIDSTVDIFTFY